MVGGFLVLASLLRLGVIANFISEPVLIGFKAGIGIVIVLDQLPKILGIHFSRGSFFHNLLAVVRGTPETSLTTLAVGIAMILLLVGIEREGICLTQVATMGSVQAWWRNTRET
jgi:MFS superfamily sulfate permease-like transporter